MTITPEQSAELLEAAKPLIKWLNENCHPHCEARVGCVTVDLAESISIQHNTEFVKG